MSEADKRAVIDALRLALLREGQPVKLPSHLEPEGSRFVLHSRLRIYEHTLVDSLVAAAEREVESLVPVWEREEAARVVCLPSFESEWALSVVGDRKAQFSVVVTEADKNIWYTMAEADEICRSPSIKIHRTELAAELGATGCDVWNSVLLQTRYSQEPLPGACDGVSYHFTYSRKEKPARAGQTWSPAKNTIPGMIVGLSHALKECAQDFENRDVFFSVIKDHLEWFRINSPENSS
jgi:hypothetical protein